MDGGWSWAAGGARGRAAVGRRTPGPGHRPTNACHDDSRPRSGGTASELYRDLARCEVLRAQLLAYAFGSLCCPRTEVVFGPLTLDFRLWHRGLEEIAGHDTTKD